MATPTPSLTPDSTPAQAGITLTPVGVTIAPTTGDKIVSAIRTAYMMASTAAMVCFGSILWAERNFTPIAPPAPVVKPVVGPQGPMGPVGPAGPQGPPGQSLPTPAPSPSPAIPVEPAPPSPQAFDFRANGRQSGAEQLRAFATALKQASTAAIQPGADPNQVKNAMVNLHSRLRSEAFDARFHAALDAHLPPNKDVKNLTPAQIAAWAKDLSDIGDGIADAASVVEAAK